MAHPIYTIEEFIKDIKEPFKSEEMTLENTANYIMKTYNGVIYDRYNETKSSYMKSSTREREGLKRPNSFTIRVELYVFNLISIDIFPKKGLMVIYNKSMHIINTIERLNFTPYLLEGILFLSDPTSIGPLKYFDNSSSYIGDRIIEGVWMKDNKLIFLKQVIIDKKVL